MLRGRDTGRAGLSWPEHNWLKSQLSSPEPNPSGRWSGRRYRGGMAEHELRIEIQPDHVLGVHADYAQVWHTPESVVIDFLAITRPPHAEIGPDGEQRQFTDAAVASRVRLAPTHVFELMKALEQQLAAWEIQTGRRATE